MKGCVKDIKIINGIKRKIGLLSKEKNSAREQDWKHWKRGFPYKGGISNKQYKADKDALFAKNGNGWWYGWTKIHTPLKGVYSSRKVFNGRMYNSIKTDNPFMTPYKIHW